MSSLPATPSKISVAFGARGLSVTNCASAAGSTTFTATNIEGTLANQGSGQGTIFQFNDLTFTGTLANGFFTASGISGGTIKTQTLVVNDVINILKNPGNGQNTLTISLNLSAVSDTLKGCKVKFRFSKASGNVSF